MAKIAEFFAELGLKKDKFDKGIEEVGESTNKLNSLFAGLGAGIAAAFSINAIKNFTVNTMKGYDQQAKAESRLMIALKGRKDIFDDLIKQASELQGISLYGDEETIAAQAMLSTMGLTGKQIKDILPGLQDFATAMSMDLVSAASLTGKAIGSTTNALARYKIELDTTSSAAEKTAIVIDKFNEMAGGQAAAAALVGTGAITQYKNALGDLSEVYGELIGVNVSGFFARQTKEVLRTTDYLNNEYIPTWEKILGFILPDLAYANKLNTEALSAELAAIGKTNKERIAAVDALKQENQRRIELIKTKKAELEASAPEREKKSLEEIKKATEAAEKAKREAWDATNKSIAEQNELIQLNADTMRGSMIGAIDDMQASIDAATTAQEKWNKAMKQTFSVEEEQDVDEDNTVEKKFWKIRESTESFITDMNAMTEAFIEDFIYGFSEGIAGLLTGDVGFDSFFNTILNSMGSFLKQMGAAVIAYGITISAFKKAFTNPIAAIAAGAALVIAGSVISNLASKGLSVGSGGGTAGMSGAGGGGYQNQVTGYGNQGGFGYTLDTKISGDDLLVIMQRAERNNKRRV